MVSFNFFVATVVFGFIGGVPIAIKYYNLGNPREVQIFQEVQILFVLMAFVYWYLLFPFCVVAAYGYNHLIFLNTKFKKAIYSLACSITIPIIFYGIGISLYYK